MLDLGDRRDVVRADLALAGAAFLFGSTFLVMQGAVSTVEPIPFLAVRFALAAVVVAPLALARPRPPAGLGRAGLLAGLALGAGYVLQTIGLQYTSSTVSAFITYLLVVFVPLLSAVVLRRPPLPASAAGVAVAVVGLVLLTASAGAGDVGLARGELLTLGCALGFALHIVVLAAVAPRFDILQLNAVQFATLAALLAVPGLLTGGYDFPLSAWVAAAYTGVVVTAVAFGLQVWGQRRVSATRTALVLMLEPVFAAALGYLDGERLGLLGAVGAAVILSGIVVSEVGNARAGTTVEP